MKIWESLKNLWQRPVGELQHPQPITKEGDVGNLGKWNFHGRNRPYFTLLIAEEMQLDPKVSFALRVNDAPLMAAEVEVTAKSQDVAKFVQEQWERLWDTCGAKVCRTSRFGYHCFEVMYEMRGERIEFSNLLDRHPRDSRALLKGGMLAGARVGNSNPEYLKNPKLPRPSNLFGMKALWTTYAAPYGRFYGESALEPAYAPYWEKRMEGGAVDLRNLRMIKDAWIGVTVKYPSHWSLTRPDGTQVSGRDIARELQDMIKSGGAVALPSDSDTTGNPMFSLESATDVSGATPIFDWGDKLDKEIWEGIVGSMEIVEAASSGSGFSGRSIPFLAWLMQRQQEFNCYLREIDEQILSPLVILNFGKSAADYEIKPKPLVETMTDLMGGGQAQQGSAPPMGFGRPMVGNVSPVQMSDGYDENGEKWITINTGDDGEGGSRIRINREGEITAGPKYLHKAGVTNLDDFGKSTNERKEKQRDNKANWSNEDRLDHAVNEALKEHEGLHEKTLRAAIDEVHGQQLEQAKIRAGIKKRARELLKLSKRQIDQMEDAGKDSASLASIDTAARTLADEYPDLGWGDFENGFDHDLGGKMWQLVREGAEEIPARHNSDIIEQAVALAKSAGQYEAPSDEEDEYLGVGDSWEGGEKRKLSAKERKQLADVPFSDPMKAARNLGDIIDMATVAADDITLEGLQGAILELLAKHEGPERDVIEEIAKLFKEVEPLLADELAQQLYEAWANGSIEVAQLLGGGGFPPVPRQPSTASPSPGQPRLPFTDEAVHFLASKGVLSAAEFYEKIKPELRKQAFTISADLTEKTLETFRSKLEENIEKGGSLANFRKAVEEEFNGLPIGESHLENVFRTNAQAAYSEGKTATLERPELVDAFPYRAFYATHDTRVRSSHLVLETSGIDGTNVYHKDDPTWKKYTPPIHYNCRCTWVPISVEQAARMGVREAQEWERSGQEPTHPPVPAIPDAPQSFKDMSEGELPFVVLDMGKQLPLWDENGERWITINTGHDHEGGQPVKIDKQGNIVGGAGGLGKKGVHKLSDFGDKDKQKENAAKTKAAGEKAEADYEKAMEKPKEGEQAKTDSQHPTSHPFKLPKNKNKLELAATEAALKHMGYSITDRKSTPLGGLKVKTEYTIAGPDGQSKTMTSKELADFVYSTSDGAQADEKMFAVEAKLAQVKKDLAAMQEGTPPTAKELRKWTKNEDGTYTTPSGAIWKKAAAGGEESPVNGKMYAGGALMPIHGQSKVKVGKGDGTGEAVDLKAGKPDLDSDNASKKKKKGGAYQEKTKNRMGDLVNVPEGHKSIEKMLAGSPSRSGRLNDTALAYLGLTRKQANDLIDIWESNDGSPTIPVELIPPSAISSTHTPSDDWDIRKKFNAYQKQKAEEMRAKDIARIQEIVASEQKAAPQQEPPAKQEGLFGQVSQPTKGLGDKSQNTGTGKQSALFAKKGLRGQENLFDDVGVKGKKVATTGPKKPHSVDLPEDKRQVTFSQAKEALEQMGYKLGKPRRDATGSIYEVTHPDGVVSNMSGDDIKLLVYGSSE